MEKIKKFFGRVFLFLKNHKYSVFIVFVAFIVSVFSLWDSYMSGASFEIPSLKLKEKVVKEEKVRAPLSGVLVSPELAARRPIAVVVENHSDARPQSGLDKASLVYETLAEGGITRFLAVYQENDVTEVGPVRSARTHFVQWAREFSAVFAHAGGSKDALSLISSLGVLDLNHNTADFWRDNTKAAPHNLYTTTDKVRNGGIKKGYSKDNEVDPFIFKEDAKEEERPESQDVRIDFSAASYKVSYVYDKAENNYKRSVAGNPHLEKVSGKQLRAKNIVVQFTDITDRSGLDTQADVIGSGKIYYFRDGKKQEGKWSKADSKSRTKYTDLDGKEITLNAGQTWVEVVRTTTNVVAE